MRDDNRGPFTTGEIAKMFRVAPRTVAKWIDKGSLVGYKIPLSQDRRVLKEELLKFIESHGLPFPYQLIEDAGTI